VSDERKYLRLLPVWPIDLCQHAGTHGQTTQLKYSLQPIAAIHQDVTDFVIPLLRCIADQQFHSFDEIKKATGLSEIDLATALATLAGEGIETEVTRGRRCRLISPFRPWDTNEILSHLGGHARAFTIDVVDQTGSTNDDLMVKARQGAPSGLVRVAELQTAGRGRRKRNWYSGPGGALTFSVLWEFSNGARALSGLPLAVGVSLVRTLHALNLAGVLLKWPNDLLWEQRKLGGILIETSGSTDGKVSAVIGIGLNLRLSPGVAERVDQPAADLETAGLQTGRSELLARVLIDLKGVLDTFSREGFAALRPEWERFHAYQDKMVCLDMSGGKHLEGRVIGVDEYGALLLDTASGRREFHGGELSLRMARVGSSD
jgi:BirA family biotin operon repressor/biotin-[acetyl-CoA-carboxylase] ligase